MSLLAEAIAELAEKEEAEAGLTAIMRSAINKAGSKKDAQIAIARNLLRHLPPLAMADGYACLLVELYGDPDAAQG